MGNERDGTWYVSEKLKHLGGGYERCAGQRIFGGKKHMREGKVYDAEVCKI